MINSVSSSANSWLPPHNIIDSLNQVMDSVSVLSDVELQQELSIFANAQFTYDVAPGVALNEGKLEQQQNKKYTRRESKQPNMHSLLNVKLASLAENNHHTSMTPDAIESYYDQSPDCSPPNGYYSPNPSPPNGFYSPNPTPPNGYLNNSNNPALFNGIQGVVNPPITFYDDDAIMGYDEDQFMKTMGILTTAYNEPQQYDQMDDTRPAVPTEKTKSPTSASRRRRSNSTHSNISSAKKSLPLVTTKKELSTIENEEGEDNDNTQDTDDNDKKQQSTLTKEDKRRRNTAASARFRVKKKLREQALRETANEMTEKAKTFENRVHELEREVKWLRALIVEKKDGHYQQLIMQRQQQQHQQQQNIEIDYQHFNSNSNSSSHHQHHSQSTLGSSNNGYHSKTHLNQQRPM